MINLQQNYQPLIAIRDLSLNTYAIDELIQEYLHQEAKPCFDIHTIVPAVYITNSSFYHSQRLANYLNQHLKINHHFHLKKGYFFDHTLTQHHWIQSQNLLIDLTVRQFLNFPQIEDQIIQMLTDHLYYLSDDPDHFLYQLYFEEL